MSSRSSSEGASSNKGLLMLLIIASVVLRFEVGSQRTQGAFRE
jgi:hypothetical protein